MGVTEELPRDVGEIRHRDQLSLGLSSVDATVVFVPLGISPWQTCFLVLIDIVLTLKETELKRRHVCVMCSVDS